jgi:hypothetical protein
MKYAKFSTQVDTGILKALKQHSADSGKSISNLVTEALGEYLQRVRTRPVFLSAMREVANRHVDLLKKLET